MRFHDKGLKKKGDKHLIEKGVTEVRLLDPLRCFIFRSMDMDMDMGNTLNAAAGNSDAL